MRNTAAWKIAFAALGALATGAAGAGKPGNPAAVVQALAEKPPHVLSELEAVGGYAVDLCVDRHGLIDTKENVPASPVWSVEGTRIISLEALAPWLPGQERM
jgi:hypothetical protein